MRTTVSRFSLALLIATLLTCSDSPTGPESQVALIGVARPVVFVEIGDTVHVSGTPRRADGSIVRDARITWRTLDPSTASVTADGIVHGVGEGLARVVGQSGSATDTVRVHVELPVLATSLTTARDTLDYLTATAELIARSVDARGDRQGRYTAIVLDNSIVSLERSDTLGRFTIAARRNGTTYVIATDRYGTADSLAISVRQRAVRASIISEGLTGWEGESRPIGASATDYAHHRVPDATFEWTTSDAAVASVDPATGVLRLHRRGKATVLAVNPDGARTSGLVEVLTPLLQVEEEHITVGRGQLRLIGRTVVGPVLADAVWAESSNPQIASVTVAGEHIRITGEREGTAWIRVGAPGLDPDSLSVEVIPLRLDLSFYHLLLTTQDPIVQAGMPGDFLVAVVDTLGQQRTLRSDVTVTMWSSDPSVLRVTSPPDWNVVPAGSAFLGIAVEGVAAGEAWVHVSAPGMSADSIRATVIPGPKLAFLDGPVGTIGARQTTSTLNGGAYGGTPIRVGVLSGVRGDIDVQLTHTAPAVVEVPSSIALPSAHVLTWFHLAGLTPGVDTIVATAPGYESDTLVLHVTSPTLTVHHVQATGSVTAPPELRVSIGDSLGKSWSPLDDVVVSIRSSDPSRLTVDDLHLEAGRSGIHYVPMLAIDTGRVTVTLSTPAAVPSYSFQMEIDPDSTVRMLNAVGTGWLGLSQRQRLEDGELVLMRAGSSPPPVVGHLRSSDPSVVDVPDSFDFVGPYAYLSAIAGERTGSATIEFTATGYAPVTVARVDVGVPRVIMSIPRVGREGDQLNLSLDVHDHWGRERTVDEDVQLTFSSTDPDVSLLDSTVVRAGTKRVVARLRLGGVGVHRYSVTDTRGAGYALAGDTTYVQVLPRVVFARGVPDTLRVGSMTDVALSLDEPTATMALPEPWTYVVRTSPELEILADDGAARATASVPLRHERSVVLRLRAVRAGEARVWLRSPHGGITVLEIPVRE